MATTKKVSVNNFVKKVNLDSKAVRANRATIVAEDVDSAFTAMVMNKEKEIRDLRREENKLMDFGRDTEFSLKVTKDDFNASEWAKKLVKVRLDLKLREEELEIINNTIEDLFTV